jgi:uncharacterized tellurite resistance protein B-like protein
MIKEQLNILINLAASDKLIDDREVKTIHMIGKAGGLSREEVDEMIKHPKTIGDLSTFTEDQKFENLYQLILMMKSDGQVFRSEVHFCETIADRLGYRKEVISELATKVYSDPSITSDRRSLMARAHKFLR